MLADADLAGIRRVEPAEHVQQRALAHARCAHDGQHLPLRHRQLEIAQHVKPVAGDVIRLVEPAHSDERHQHPRAATSLR